MKKGTKKLWNEKKKVQIEINYWIGVTTASAPSLL